MYATDRRQTKASLNASAIWRGRHNNPQLIVSNAVVQLVLWLRANTVR